METFQGGVHWWPGGRRRRPRAWSLAARLALAGLLATPPAAADFIRGDANGDGRVDLVDAVAQVRVLLGLGGAGGCDDAADANDDGELDVADALTTLRFLFAGTAEIPNPGALARGPDPTCDRLGCARDEDPTPAVVISEIQYNPLARRDAEFIELHNRSPMDIDAGGYRFTDGISFTIPEGTVIPGGGYLLVLRNPGSTLWRRNPAPKTGPYAGQLADGGERLTLVRGNCLVESLRWDDRPPWPAGADGYGPSLERIDPRLPAADHHSWRASTARSGTPGEDSSVAGTPPRPTIVFWSIDPAAPSSGDSVEVRVTLDAPAVELGAVALRFENVGAAVSPAALVPMEEAARGEDWVNYRALLGPVASQTLVRFRLEVELAGGEVLLLPHVGERAPFLSYFAYDGEIDSLLPVLWLFPRRRSEVAGGSFASGVVVREADMPELLVFDGAEVRNSQQGQKVRFLKGAELRGDRTINIVPEAGGGGTGTNAPHMEHLGFLMFRELGAMAPWAEWFRVVDYGAGGGLRHTQRLVIEQVNERFFAMNGLDPDGDIYKLDKNSFRKQNNVDTGPARFLSLVARLGSGNSEVRRSAVMQELDLDSVCRYSAISVLIENWDGFHNNLFIYHPLGEGSRIQLVPWDLDQVFEACCFDFPLDFPLRGQYGGRSRETGPISRPYHLEPELDRAYRDLLRSYLEEAFTVEVLEGEMAAAESLLLEDLALEEAYLGASRPARRAQIERAYQGMRTYVRRRIPFLQAALEEGP